MDFSSSLKRKRDHPSSRDDFKPLASLDRNMQQPWKHVKSELHRHGSVDGSVPNLSRLDKARSFARKDRNGSNSGSFISAGIDIRSDARIRERGVVDRGNLQGSASVPKKLGYGNIVKQNADEKQERVVKSAEEGFISGHHWKSELIHTNRMTALVSDSPRDLGHGMDNDADQCLSQGRVLAYVDTQLEQPKMAPEKDCFKRIVKLRMKHSSLDVGRESNFSRTRSQEEKNLGRSPSKSNKGSPDENSGKSLSSTRACRAGNSSSAEKSVAENPLPFLHVTRRARSERRRDDSGKSYSSKAVSLDGFCAELEEVLLKKQEAEVNSSEALISAALSGHKVASLLEETDEREEGEFEPDDEASERLFSGGGNEVENVKGFEMHVEKTSQDCSDSDTSKSCKNQSLSKSSRPDSTLSAAEFERNEEERRQDCDGLENQKGCKVASGCLLLHTEPSRHCINSDSSRDAGEVVKSQTIPISDVVINSVGIGVEKQKNSIDGFCQDVFNCGTEDSTDAFATHLDSLKSNIVNSISNAHQTKTSLHGGGDAFVKIHNPSVFIVSAAQIQRASESDQSHGENQTRDSRMKTEGENSRDSVKELDDFSVYGRKEKKVKIESLQLSLALPEFPSGSSPRSLAKPVDNELCRTQVVRRTQSLSHLRTESLSNGFTTSLSLSSFVHNPSCSLNCTLIGDQELSCGGSRQAFQVSGCYSDGDGQGLRCKENVQKRLSNTKIDDKPVSPVCEKVLQDGKLLGSGIGLLSHTIGVEDHAARGSYQCAPGHGNFIVQDSVQKLHKEAPPLVLKSNSEGSQSIDVNRVSNVKVGLLEISSEPIAAMAQKLQELPDGFLEGLKGLVKDLLGSFAKREEFLALQEIIRTRRDLTEETLLRAHPTQLEILVSLKTGMQSFMQQDAKSLTYKALIEIFLQTRCGNVDCQQMLPVDGCECTVCSEKKGFCHECMCMVCSKFDSDSNTCRWVGCDICMHWCHTDCGIRMSNVKSTFVSHNGFEFLEMQYQCLSCGHYMELYGFVKGVFENFANTWGAETLAKELDCVRRIFHGSEDARGKQLFWKAEEMLQMLERSASIQDVCSSLLLFFSEDHTQSSPVAPKKTQLSGIVSYMDGANKAFATMGSLVARKLSSFAEDKKELEGREVGRSENMRSKDGSQDFHSIIGAKLTDVLMYQARADAAREDAINLQHIISLKTKKIEEVYSIKSAKLRLDAAEEQRRKRLEELQALERSHHDYEIMKLRIETDMKHLMMKIMERFRFWLDFWFCNVTGSGSGSVLFCNWSGSGSDQDFRSETVVLICNWFRIRIRFLDLLFWFIIGFVICNQFKTD
ncbi:hypothetical protein L7F22_029732 [Adiantum nelumboides]|nr:hypothetical protein [Adiantum nelumboides]